MRTVAIMKHRNPGTNKVLIKKENRYNTINYDMRRTEKKHVKFNTEGTMQLQIR